jgi:hypothetical protein
MIWSGRQDLNLRPLDPQLSTQSADLRKQRIPCPLWVCYRQFTVVQVTTGSLPAPVLLLLLVTLRTGGGQLCCSRRGQGDEPALTLEALAYATECLLLTTVTSLAIGIEWIVLIFMAGHHLT